MCERVNIEKLVCNHIGFFVEFKDVCANFSPWYFWNFMRYNWFSRLLVVFFKTDAELLTISDFCCDNKSVGMFSSSNDTLVVPGG